jgi:hypothetical protein
MNLKINCMVGKFKNKDLTPVTTFHVLPLTDIVPAMEELAMVLCSGEPVIATFKNESLFKSDHIKLKCRLYELIVSTVDGVAIVLAVDTAAVLEFSRNIRLEKDATLNLHLRSEGDESVDPETGEIKEGQAV